MHIIYKYQNNTILIKQHSVIYDFFFNSMENYHRQHTGKNGHLIITIHKHAVSCKHVMDNNAL